VHQLLCDPPVPRHGIFVRIACERRGHHLFTDDNWRLRESPMKKFSIAIALATICSISAMAEGKPPVMLANPLQGTDSSVAFRMGMNTRRSRCRFQ